LLNSNCFEIITLSAFLHVPLQKMTTDVFPEEAQRVLDKHAVLLSPNTCSAVFFKMPLTDGLTSVRDRKFQSIAAELTHANSLSLEKIEGEI